MKKLLFLLILLAPARALADRLGGLRSGDDVALSSKTVQNQDTLQAGSTYYVREGLIDYRLGIGTSTPQTPVHIQVPDAASPGAPVIRIDSVGTNTFSPVLDLFHFYDGSTATALTDIGSVTANLSSRVISVGNNTLGLNTGYTSPGTYSTSKNDVNVRGSIGVSELDVSASTTLNSTSAGFIYSVDASAGNVAVTVSAPTLPNIPFGQWRRICKVDGTANTVTMPGNVVLSEIGTCADWYVSFVTGGTSYKLRFLGLTKSTAPVSSNQVSLSTGVTGTLSSASLDSSSVTLQGNNFNSAGQLVQLNGSTQLPAVSGALLTSLPAANLTGTVPSSTLDSSSVTKQGNVFNGASQLVQTGSTSLIPNANVDSSSVTKQGNTFNGASQLIKTGSDTFVPNANIDSSSVTKNGPTTSLDEVQGGTARTGDSFNFSNAIVTIPNGASPTLSSLGQCAYDTTTGQVLCHDGFRAQVVAVATNSFSVGISSGLGFNGRAAHRAFTNGGNESITITKIEAFTLPASSTVIYQLDGRVLTASNAAGSSVFSVTYSTGNNSSVTTTSFSNATLAAGSGLFMTFPTYGASAGSPYELNLTIYYIKDRQ